MHILTVGAAMLALAACGDKTAADKAGGAPKAGTADKATPAAAP